MSFYLTRRCIDWKKIEQFGPSIFNGSVRETNIDTTALYNMSRPLEKDQKYIDYFISHAWSDGAAEQKFNILKRISENFHLKYHRYPSFWFDKGMYI